MSSRRLFLSRLGNWLALALVTLFVVAALAGPRLLTPSVAQRDPFKKLPLPPGGEHPLGTVGGSDVWAGLVLGARDALRLGLTVTALTAVLGVALGAVSGYAGGLTNAVLMRLTDAFLAFPAVAAVWVIGYVLVASSQAGEPTSLTVLMIRLRLSPVMLALILFSWMPYARLINTTVTRLKREAYVEAARALGAGPERIILRHLLPNAIAPAVVQAARAIGSMVILATAFAFVGVSGESSQWGSLLLSGRDYVMGAAGNPLRYWWTYLPVSLALVLFGVAWNLLGDGLNGALNPRQRY